VCKMRNVVTLDRMTLRETSLVDFDVGSLESDVCIKIKEAMVCKILTTSNDKPPSN
jgi:hypothetical protein